MSCRQRFCTSGATRIAERRSRGFIAVPLTMFTPLVNDVVAARPFFPPDEHSGRKEKRTIERCQCIKNNQYGRSIALVVLLRREGFERNGKKIASGCFGGIVIVCKLLCSATSCAGLLNTTRKCEILPYYGKKTRLLARRCVEILPCSGKAAQNRQNKLPLRSANAHGGNF